MSFIPIPVTRSFYLDCADFICRSPLRGLSGTVAVEIGSSQAATAVCSLPPCGGGLGRGVGVVARDMSANCYPRPSPQGGGERTVFAARRIPISRRCVVQAGAFAHPTQVSQWTTSR